MAFASSDPTREVAQTRPAGRRYAEMPPEEPGTSPKLSETQIAALSKYGVHRDVSDGDVLVAQGDVFYDLVVVLEGELEVVEHFGLPDEAILVTYGPSEFLGELSLITGQHSFYTAIVRSTGRVLRIPPDQLRVVMAQEADLSELLLRSFLIRRARLTRRGSGLTLIGSRFDPETRRILELLARNRVSSRWLELEAAPEAEEILQCLHVPAAQLPIVIIPGGDLLRSPSNRELLDALGLSGVHDRASDGGEVCDLLVVGGGPAGLAAAVYGASEGMATTLAEQTALGGQAGTSSRIENYLGFPAGLSGDELTARAALQAQKFGVRIKGVANAVRLERDDGVHRVHFSDGEVVAAKSVIIATGAQYNRLPLERLSQFEGVGVYYAATQMESQACAGGPTVIVGGGNSAGQAALFLSRTSPAVHIVIRRGGLEETMSRYLIDQIERHPSITVHPHSEVCAIVGDPVFAGVEVVDRTDEHREVIEASGLFVFIGADPCTGWLAGQLAVDEHGFLLTGDDVPIDRAEGGHVLALESSRPGIFCVGDVRSRSVKRVAAAIGEGSMAVRLVFERLAAAGLDAGNPTIVVG